MPRLRTIIIHREVAVHLINRIRSSERLRRPHDFDVDITGERTEDLVPYIDFLLHGKRLVLPGETRHVDPFTRRLHVLNACCQ